MSNEARKFRIGDLVKAPDGTVGRVTKIDDSDLPFLVENGQTAPWYYRADELELAEGVRP